MILMYDSKVLNCDVFAHDDLVELFLEQAKRVGLKLYMGLYDSGDYWIKMQWDKEVSINLELIDELLGRYGEHEAFYGWYLSHEPELRLFPWNIWNPLITKMREMTPEKPVLLSPRFEGRKYSNMLHTPDVYANIFDHAMGHVEGHIDAAAFMDGHVGIGELRDYFSAMKPVMDKHGIELWSNLETFDRDMPIKFPAIDWLKMRTKLEAVQPYVSNIITFEAPHFLSPYSMRESGRRLFDRYMEYIK